MDLAEMNEYEAFVAGRREAILERLAQAAAVSGRTRDDVTVLAVSKTVSANEVLCAWHAGYRAFGENRPQELRRKADAIDNTPEMAGARLDMIGNLQTNKINQVLGCAELIHSVSSLHLAEAISKRALAKGLVAKVLLEVNVSGEESKSGFSPALVTEQLDEMLTLPGLALEGLMTMAPANDPSEARRTFSGLRELREDLRGRSGRSLDVLSMGMSDDFGIAVEEGSTLIRLGRVVFDPSHPLGE